MSKGLGLPNAGGREYTQTELSAAVDLGIDSFLALAYPGDVSQRDRVKEEAWLCGQIGNWAPDIRLYLPNVMGLSPNDVSFELYMVHQLYMAAGMRPRWHPWNEANMPYERGLPDDAGLQEDWDTQIAFAKAFIGFFRMRLPDAAVYIPALSPQGAYLDGLARYMALTGYDGIALHAYTPLDLQDVQTVRNITGQAPTLSEWNQLSAATVFALNVPSFYFIEDSPDPNFWKYSLLRNPGLYSDFKSASISPSSPPKEEPMPEFALGFKKLADRLGADVVGEPTMPERTIPLGTFGYTFQLTTRGQMVYTEGAQPLFLSATFPNP